MHTNKHILRWLSLFFIILVGFSGCSNTTIESETAQYYAQFIQESYPDELVVHDTDNPFAEVKKGSIYPCFKVQAESALQNNVVKEYTPECLATIVFAIDKDQTDAVVHSWKDLESSECVIGFTKDRIFQSFILAACNYGLTANYQNTKNSVPFFKNLHDRGFLKTGNKIYPITICFDYEAAHWIDSGKNIEIIIPEDGTLSFELGVVSNHILKEIPSSVWKHSLFRTLEGNTYSDIYPSDYSSSMLISSFQFDLLKTTNDVRRKILNIRLYSPITNYENIIVNCILILLIILWASIALHKSADKKSTRWIFQMSVLIIFWLLLALVKYLLPVDYDFIWYSYYLFIGGLPLFLFYISTKLDCEKPSKWFHAFFMIYCVFMVIVFTNNFHEWFFQFEDPTIYNSSYTYNWAYYLFFLYCLILFFSSISILIRKCWNYPKKSAKWYPIIVGILLIFYCIGYVLKISFFVDSNITQVFSVFSILILDSILNSGLIPTNNHYQDLFNHSNLNLQILDRHMKRVYGNCDTHPLSQQQLLQIQKNPNGSFLLDKDTKLFSHLIRGGYVIWYKDITLLNQIQNNIQNSVSQIQKTNKLLSKEKEIQSKNVTAQIDEQLYNQLEADIKNNIDSLKLSIQDLENSKDTNQQMTFITILLCHIKRRCNLFFLSQQNKNISSDELSVYLDELNEFANYANINALVRCCVDKIIPNTIATQCYDIYFKILSWAILESNATLIGQLECLDDHIEFNILSSEKINDLSFITNKKNMQVDYASNEDMESIRLTFSLKEESDHV